MDCVIESTHEFNTGGDLIREAVWKSNAFLKIIPNDAKHFQWYLGMIFDLCNLLTLLIGETTFISYVKACGDDVKISPDKKTKEVIELFFTQKSMDLKKYSLL